MPSRRLAAAGELLAAAPDKLRALPRRAGLALGAIAAVALAIGIVVAAGLPGSSPAASSSKKVAGATTVQRRDLVATDTESGTLTYSSPQTVFNRRSGTITWLPKVGQLVKPGQTLYQVDGQPVILLSGTTPAYRDLTSGVSDGPDVLELNQDLVAMGFDPGHEITVDNSWQSGTTDAVERWQASVGESQTGTISLGQVVFLPGAQRITSVNTVLGSTGGAGVGSGAGSGASSGSGSSSGAGSGSSSGAGSSTGASATASPRTEFVGLTTTTQNGPAAATASSGGGTADTAATVMNAWNAACAAHDLQQLESLKQRHPNLLASVQPSSCAAAPATQPDSSQPKAPGATPAPGNSAVEASRITPGPGSTTPPASTTPTTPTTPNTSGAQPPRGSGGKTSGKGANNAAVLRALEALLKAETLELQQSRGSSSRGGGNAASAGASGAGRLSSSPGAGLAGGSASSASGGGPSAGGGGGASSAGSGGSANAQPILGTTSTQLNAVVNLDATKQSEARVGEPVTVQMPDGSVVDGKIIQVSPVAQSSSSGNGSSNGSSSGSGTSGSSGSSSTPTSTVPVTIALHGRLPASGLDQAAVSVNFEQQVERGVMSVPVTALLATAGGGYAVQEAAQPHRLIPVTPGLFAAGYVQISSSQIYPGLQVTDSQG